MKTKFLKFLVMGFLAAAAGFFYMGFMAQKEADSVSLYSGQEEILLETESSSEGTEAETIPSVYFIHVCGAVKCPGVYELSEGSRIFEAVEAAGGFAEDAAEGYLNLAEAVTDGMKVAVPTVEELASQGISALGTEGKHAGESQSSDGRVNINTASKEQLMTLSGIGEAKADDIIRYREENGSFQTIEDIMKISGIKEAAFKKIKDDITVQ